MRAVTSEGLPGSGAEPRATAPPPLQVASALAGIEAFVLLALAVSLVPAMETGKFAMDITSIVFFLLYGGTLGWCAWQLRRCQSWARSPVVFAQLIQLGVAYSFWGDPTTAIAIALAVTALLVIAGALHPQSLRALAPD